MQSGLATRAQIERCFVGLGMMSNMESQRNIEVMNFAKQELEAQARKIQEKMGGSDSSSVFTVQVVLRSAIGKNTEQVRFRCGSLTQCWVDGRGKEGIDLYYGTRTAWSGANSYLSPCESFLLQAKSIPLLCLKFVL